jgi:thiamine biosynthesis lipoprotein
MFSRYRRETFISRLNRDGIVRGVPPEVVHVVQSALEYSALTGGAFDVTVAPLLDLYRSSFDRTGAPPPESELDKAFSLVGYRHVLVDDGAISFGKRGMSVTLDGIAKGYIVDRAVRVLEELGAKRVLIDAGGDMGTVGERSPGEGWRLAIQHPRNQKSYLGTLQLHGESVATSGDYLQYFTEDKRLHHILDPRTGRSPAYTSAVTVVTPTAMEADALSTAVFVLGPRDGLRLLNQLQNVEGVIVTKRQEVLRSRKMNRYSV